MASAVLPSRNDPRSSDFITKFTDSNLNFTRLQKIPTRNPNPNLTHFVTSNTSRDFNRKNHLEPGLITPLINSGYRYITFRLDSYTKRELKGLKKRLISDLQRVRILRQFVCSTQIPKTPVELPPASVVTYTGQKRAKPVSAVRDTKKQFGRVTVAQRTKMMMRECGQILGKLMKHKHGWVFNSPVDAAAMKLYDYHNVINNPMDLGTIRAKLVKNEYESPLAFASDVRLTFENAMLYNGRGSDVFVMAERLLLLFENMFNSTQNLSSQEAKFVTNQAKKQNLSASVLMSVEKPVIQQPIAVNIEKQMIKTLNCNQMMTDDEKSELAERFMNLHLGPEGMKQIMAIVKKGAGLEHQGDEIELDLAVLDNDTLWELHGFMNRTINKQDSSACNMITSVQTDYGGEEDVDIGEEMQLTNYPSVVIEKDVVNGSSSGSDSSSDSDSSSSDFGSGTSYNEHEVNSTPKDRSIF